MDYSKYLRKEIIDYINANLHGDLHSLLLKKSPFQDVSMSELGQQINGRQVAEKKFPSYIKDGIVFPPKLNLEQTSSESTAKYKASQVKGKFWLDLTSGLGIDSFFMSENFEKRILVERDLELAHIVKHNWAVLGRSVEVINAELESFIQNFENRVDVVYLDPARRDSSKKKVFLLEDLSPNILEIQQRLLEIGELIVIKLSPLIDLSYLIEVLPTVFKIEVIAVKNEVKEVLVYLQKTKFTEAISINCVNLESSDKDFQFTLEEEHAAVANFSAVKDYLYIPNNSITKAGAFKSLATRLSLEKLHANTHFYTSDKIVEHFPGRKFKVENISAKDIKKGDYYNIISKNYPVKPEDLKKKFKTKDGGENYLIFTQDLLGKKILKATPL